jgi:hypothetical protein
VISLLGTELSYLDHAALLVDFLERLGGKIEHRDPGEENRRDRSSPVRDEAIKDLVNASAMAKMRAFGAPVSGMKRGVWVDATEFAQDYTPLFFRRRDGFVLCSGTFPC